MNPLQAHRHSFNKTTQSFVPDPSGGFVPWDHVVRYVSRAQADLDKAYNETAEAVTARDNYRLTCRDLARLHALTIAINETGAPAYLHTLYLNEVEQIRDNRTLWSAIKWAHDIFPYVTDITKPPLFGVHNAQQ
jgi:hypothetical protein